MQQIILQKRFKIKTPIKKAATIFILDLPYDWFEKVPNNPDKVGRVDQEECLEVFLVPPVQGLVGVP
jgi:hypothetical protein